MRKILNINTAILSIILVCLIPLSCKQDKNESTDDLMNSEMPASEAEINHDDRDFDVDDKSNDLMQINAQTSDAKMIMADYMTLKNALVATNQADAANAGNKMVISLKGLDVSGFTAEQQTELNKIIAEATEQAEHIGNSEMTQQREHFKILSQDMMDMVAITGTEVTLYQIYCPMYDRGSSWLSMENEVKNPYYGSKMLSCGKVEKEIN